MDLPEIEFDRIRPAGLEGQREGFEQFVCELAAVDPPAPSAHFVRLRGAGGDGGVECFWTLKDESEHGWQAKYWTDPRDVDKGQLDRSVETALDIHPSLTRYTIAIPIDPTGPTGSPGMSLLEKVIGTEGATGWRGGWQRMASDRGMNVDFRVEWKTDLIGRLQATDTNGVRTRYWFDADLLPDGWWQDRLVEALHAARPRYIPELNVPVTAATAMAALCGDPEWSQELERQMGATELSLSELARDAGDALEADLSAVQAAGQAAMAALAVWRDRPDPATRQNLDSALETGRHAGAEQERREAEAMDAKHGPGWDTPGWRQFQAEYQVSFPAAPVDSLRAFIQRLEELRGFVGGPFERLPGARLMLLTGAAGSGKTFVTCDTVSRRLKQGRPSVLVHGRWFRDGDPLIQLRDRLQLPSDLTGQETLAVLDQAGRAAGVSVLLVVDALNDSVPRKIWRDHLDRLIPMIDRHDHLRVVLTVRTHYRAQVIPDDVDLPTFDHRGFEGVEFEAVTEYADFYELEAPASPPIHGEFDNPLYLRLLCEALRAGGRLSLEQAGMGLSELAELLLDTKNQAISDQLSAPRNDRIVHRAMGAIAEALGSGRTGWLERSVARDAIAEIWADTTAEGSLLEALIGEGLVAEDLVPGYGSGDIDVVVMAFERLGHHLIVNQSLRDVGSATELREELSGGPLRPLLGLDDAVDRGLLEGLSVAAAELFEVELTEVSDVLGDEVAVLSAVVAGLPWRSPKSITSATRDAVMAALRTSGTFAEAMEMSFRLAAKPDHPMNADWLHDLLAPLRMADRDAFLVPWLHDTHDSGGAVDRLVRWGRERSLEAVGPTTCRLWVTALLWCTGSSDRRVRDGATVASARLLSRHPHQAKTLLEALLGIDDDWIIERTLIITSAALLRAGTQEDWASAAAVVWEEVFADRPPTNAAIRDEARSILEAADERDALPPGADPAQFRPPYASSWPIDWPEEADVAPYQDRDRYPKLVWSSTQDDFFRYQVSWVLRDRDGIEPIAAGRRVVLDVIGMGYEPDRHGRFDRNVLARFGGGRAKPAWMERIGKKYQWIALARLTGVVSDHTTRTPDPWDPPIPSIPGPQGDRLRHLDPTMCEPTVGAGLSRRWVPEYDWSSVETTPDEEWVPDDDIPGVGVNKAVLADRPHLVLSGAYDWGSPKRSDANERRIWVHVSTLLVVEGDLPSVLEELDGRDLGGDSLVQQPMMTTGFVGEYPFGVHYGQDRHVIEHEATQTLSVPTRPGSFHLLGEYEYAPDDLSTVSIGAPSPLVFGDPPGSLRWDGESSWRDDGGLTVARVRHKAGPNNELTIDQEWFQDWLRSNDYTLVWLEVSGKDVLGHRRRGTPGRLIRTRILYGTGGDIDSLPPVHYRIPPQQD